MLSRAKAFVYSAAAFTLLLGTSAAFGQISVLTQHYDNARTGQNTQESILTPANVNSKQFGKLFAQSLDGQMPAQPLYVPNVFIPGLNSTHNVVYAVTMHDSVYAFDADNNQGSNASPLWQVNFLDPANGVTSVPLSDESCSVGYTEFGIQGTPVIDLTQHAIYLLAMTEENGNFVHRLHALDLGTGAELFGGPVVVSASSVVNGKTYTFIDRYQMQRTGLLLQNGIIYLGFGSPGCNVETENGWVMAYDQLTLQQVGVFNVSPGVKASAVWQSGGGLAGDGAGNVFFATGDGLFDGPGGTHFGDSVIRLNQGDGVLNLADSFTPYNQKFFQQNNLDVGSGQVQMLPQQPDGRNFLLAIDKNGTAYLLDQTNLGGYNSAGDYQIQQELDVPVLGEVHAGLTYWNNTVYIAAFQTPVMAYTFAGDQLSLEPTSQTPAVTSNPQGGIVSSSGTENGIFWYVTSPSNKLFAYDATNLATQFYNSAQGGKRDTLGAMVHFPMPVVANGKLYINGQTALSVFGLLSQSATNTTIASSMNPSIYGQAVSFTATVASGAGTPAGTVQFDIDGGAFGSPVTLASGSATSGSISTLATGTHTVTAVYSGATGYAPSTGTLSGGEVVSALSTSTMVASSLNPSTSGQAVSFTANVTAGSGTPTGTVQFNIDGSAFGSPVTLASGSATSGSISTLAVGTHTVTAVYSGDTNDTGSTGTLNGGQVVNPLNSSTTTTVASSLNPSTYGQAVSFTASVTSGSGTPTGTVQFNIDGTAFGSPVTLSSGSAVSGSISTLAVGTHSVTAVYSGDSNFQGSTGALSGGEIVNALSTSTTVASSLNPSTYGQAVSFTASVTSGSGTPTGTVQFNIDGTAFGSPVTLASGSAVSGSISTLAVGTHSVTAVYSGGSNFLGSTGTLSGGEIVNLAGSNVSVASSLNPSVYGQPVTFTATIGGEYGLVKGNKSMKPLDVSGTVTWSANTGCGTTPVTTGNPGAAVCTTSSLTGGTDTITATYSGDSNHSGGSATLGGGQVVNQASQSITVTTPAPATAINHSSFTIVAAASSGLPITFTSSGACTNSGATYTMNASGKTCTETMAQPGNSNYLAATTVIEQTTETATIQPTVSFTGAPASALYQSTFTVTASSTNDPSIPAITSNGSCSLSNITASGTTVTATVTMTSGNGTCTLKAAWPLNSVYAAASVTQKTTAEKITSVITWPTPAPITYGTRLSATQLDATANVPGRFVYSPAAGTKPPLPTPPATCDTLSVTFTPTQTADYTTATGSVCLVVNP
ncbi:MAG: Ig-like domain-containing protein [Terriglobales bacterium]